MIVLGIDPGPETHGAVVYDTRRRRVLWSAKAATSAEVLSCAHPEDLDFVLMERPAAMGQIGVGMAQHMLDTAWVASWVLRTWELKGVRCETMTRREVLRSLGVLSGTGSADSRVRAACIADHGRSKREAVGLKKSPGPLYRVSSHAWQALGLVLAWLETRQDGGE